MAEINDDLLNKLIDQMTTVQVSVARLEEKVETVIGTTTDLTKAIRGNGKPGLNDRVRDLETTQANHLLTCPVKPIVDELQKKQEAEDKEKEDLKKSHKDAVQQRNQTLVGFFVSVVLLAISTGVDIWLYVARNAATLAGK